MNNSQELNKIQYHKFNKQGRLIQLFTKKTGYCCMIMSVKGDICFPIIVTQDLLNSDQSFEIAYNVIEYILDRNIGMYLNFTYDTIIKHNIRTNKEELKKEYNYWFRLIDKHILLELL